MARQSGGRSYNKEKNCEAARDDESQTNDDPLLGDGGRGHFGIAPVDCIGATEDGKAPQVRLLKGKGCGKASSRKAAGRRRGSPPHETWVKLEQWLRPTSLKAQ